jgi:hypothetical protein
MFMSALLGMSVFVLSGCASIHGTWDRVEIVPHGADQGFMLKSLTLKSNGNFMADAVVKGQPEELQGTYEFDQKAERLTFQDTKGREHAYHASMVCTCKGQLRVWNVGEHKEWVAEFARR